MKPVCVVAAGCDEIASGYPAKSPCVSSTRTTSYFSNMGRSTIFIPISRCAGNADPSAPERKAAEVAGGGVDELSADTSS